jgi:hypothetical protein
VLIVAGNSPVRLDPGSIEPGKRELADIAAQVGVPLQPIPQNEDPGVSFAFLPDNLDWPEIHVTLMLVNWRMQVCDAPRSYCAHWCYPGIGFDTFLTVLHHLQLWGGDPADEPTGWVKRFGTLDVAYNWRRRPGLRLSQLGWESFQPAWAPRT